MSKVIYSHTHQLIVYMCDFLVDCCGVVLPFDRMIYTCSRHFRYRAISSSLVD